MSQRRALPPPWLPDRAESYSTLGCFDIPAINHFPFSLSICASPYKRNHVAPLRDPWENPDWGDHLMHVEESHVTRKAATYCNRHQDTTNGPCVFLDRQLRNRVRRMSEPMAADGFMKESVPIRIWFRTDPVSSRLMTLVVDPRKARS